VVGRTSGPTRTAARAAAFARRRLRGAQLDYGGAPDYADTRYSCGGKTGEFGWAAGGLRSQPGWDNHRAEVNSRPGRDHPFQGEDGSRERRCPVRTGAALTARASLPTPATVPTRRRKRSDIAMK